MLPPVPFTRERTDTTQLRDNAKNKAESTHETMGLVSAVVAGFEVTALVEVELCKDDECTGVEDAFIGLASTVIGLSTFILVEGALEYGFVVRELHYGHESAWGSRTGYFPPTHLPTHNPWVVDRTVCFGIRDLGGC